MYDLLSRNDILHLDCEYTLNGSKPILMTISADTVSSIAEMLGDDGTFGCRRPETQLY